MNPEVRSHSNTLRIIAALTILFIAVFQPAWSPARSESTAQKFTTQGSTALSKSHLIPAVLYLTSDQHIHEIALKGTWQARDLTAAAGAPLFHPQTYGPIGFQRSDGVSMAIYRGEDNHIHAIYLALVLQGNTWQEVWHWADLTAITGSPDAASDPYGYVRSDGISTVVYVGTDSHIHDLRLETSWIWADLTLIAGAPSAAAKTRIVAYVRGDGINTIVFRALSDGHICELRLDNGWKWADLSALSGLPIPTIIPWEYVRLSAYVRSDGISTINYTSADGHIYDIRLENTWIGADLTAISGGPIPASEPVGYVRSDGINAIVYSSWDLVSYHIYELRLDSGWQYYELTSVPGAVQGVVPVGYVRADGISSVVYFGLDKHIHEIRLENDGWHWADLTSLSAAPVASGYRPSPYNRSAAASVYLPLVIR
jgi:hypothetical protein